MAELASAAPTSGGVRSYFYFLQHKCITLNELFKAILLDTLVVVPAVSESSFLGCRLYVAILCVSISSVLITRGIRRF